MNWRPSFFITVGWVAALALGLSGSSAMAINPMPGEGGGGAPPPSSPRITIHRAYPATFSVPYGRGLRMEYSFSLGNIPGRIADSVTTQYSPDDGRTWHTDEANRQPNYGWDNIHGNIVCGPTRFNLASGHTYTLRAVLNWRDARDLDFKAYSNVVKATVEDYAELCVQDKIAQKFKPVLHRHPNDLQPEGLIDLDQVRWGSRQVVNALGQTVTTGITQHSPFHWNHSYGWDTYGRGQSAAFFRWAMDPGEHYKEERPGERPLYYHVYKEGPYYYVQYWYFMTMNNIKGQTNEKTWHEGDFEHVAIEVEKVGNTFVPRRVNFYQHEGGKQYPAGECWWGAPGEGGDLGTPPQKGYHESRPRLHVWIARNSHASYNFRQPLYEISVAGDVYRDDVSYDPDPRTNRYETFFRYDYLVNMGEISRSSDTDHDGYDNAHGWEWFEHWEHVPAWQDLQWLPFRGRLGKFWCKKADGTIVTFVLLAQSICTPSPYSPAWGGHWRKFEDNEHCGGFGHRDSFPKDFRWRDPYSGQVVCNP